MRQRKIFFSIPAMLFVFFLAVLMTLQLQATVKNGLMKENGRIHYYENGKLVKYDWRTVNGDSYFFNKHGNAFVGSHKINKQYYIFRSNGKLCKCKSGKMIEVDGEHYLADQNGHAVKGWKVINDQLYHLDKTGRMEYNVRVENIYLTKSGPAKMTKRAILKKEVVKVLASVTEPSMSKKEKLRAVWNYVTGRSRFHYSMKYPNLTHKGWFRTTARDMLLSKRGNCYSFACAFAALAYEVGYEPIIICGRVSGSRDGASDGLTRHSWVLINGNNYDPEAQFAGWKTGVYNLSYYSTRHTIQKKVQFTY